MHLPSGFYVGILDPEDTVMIAAQAAFSTNPTTEWGERCSHHTVHYELGYIFSSGIAPELTPESGSGLRFVAAVQALRYVNQTTTCSTLPAFRARTVRVVKCFEFSSFVRIRKLSSLIKKLGSSELRSPKHKDALNAFVFPHTGTKNPGRKNY